MFHPHTDILLGFVPLKTKKYWKVTNFDDFFKAVVKKICEFKKEF